MSIYRAKSEPLEPYRFYHFKTRNQYHAECRFFHVGLFGVRHGYTRTYRHTDTEEWRMKNVHTPKAAELEHIVAENTECDVCISHM